MKPPHHLQLITCAWLFMSATSAQAAYFSCPTGEVCSYASAAVTANVTALPGDGASGDITGGPLYVPTIGLILAATTISDPTPASTITVQLLDPIYQMAWIITDELTTPVDLDERMEVLASINNGGSFFSLGTFFNYNANDPFASIDLTGFADINNPVTHLQIKGLDPDIDLGCVLGGGTNCTSFDNAMEILGVAGIMAPEASAVPVPAAAWLFGSGLLGLFGVARHRRK